MSTINIGNMNATIGAASELVLPTQPAFLGQATASIANVTGDATVYTCVYDEIFDRGGNFVTSTFTAPVTGYYLFLYNISIANLGAAHVDCVTSLVTTARTYSFYINPYAYCQGCSYGTIRNNVLCYLTATDTAYTTLQVSGGTKTVSLYGNAIASTTFSGCLLG